MSTRARTRRGARERFVRSDDATLARIRVQRAANRVWRMPRGARWRHVCEDGTPTGDTFELWAVRDTRLPDGRRYPHVVFRSIENPGAFVIFDDRMGPPDPRGWC